MLFMDFLFNFTVTKMTRKTKSKGFVEYKLVLLLSLDATGVN